MEVLQSGFQGTSSVMLTTKFLLPKHYISPSFPNILRWAEVCLENLMFDVFSSLDQVEREGSCTLAPLFLSIMSGVLLNTIVCMKGGKVKGHIGDLSCSLCYKHREIPGASLHPKRINKGESGMLGKILTVMLRLPGKCLLNVLQAYSK